MQARAEATRRRILDSAVQLFAEFGYGETGLADVLQRANVSKGAFYYHFDSKEAVATAIIDEFNQKVTAAVDENFDMAAPSLSGLIRATFAVQHLMHHDPVTRIGQMLSQALSQVSGAGSQIYAGWTERFVEMVKLVVAAGDMHEELDVIDVAESLWTGVLGCHLVSAAVGGDPFTRLARPWRVMLRSAVPQESLAEVHGTLDGIAAEYRAALGAQA